MTRKRKASKAPKEAKKFKEYVDVEPDPNNDDFYYDEIDQFNMEKEKILLGDTLKSQKKKAAVEEEVFAVAADYDSDEDEANLKNIENLLKTSRSASSSKAALLAPNSFAGGEDDDDEEEQRGTTWGTRKKDEYGADVTGEFDISDSEENAALLEEKEALAIQKRQLEQLDENDFDFAKYKKQLASAKDSVQQVQKDRSKLTLEEKQELVKKENPELVPIYLDTIQKCKEVKKTLCPIVDAYNKGQLPKHEFFDYLKSKLGLYSVHFSNVAFYRSLKLKHVNTENHPVVERIFAYTEKFKKLKQMDQKDATAVKYVLKMLKKGSGASVTVEALDKLLGKEEIDEIPSESVEASKKSVKFADEEEEEEEEAGDAVQETSEVDEDEEDRIVDKKIERNKGITAKRKKMNRNPRIKYKEKYRKSLIKQRGKRPQHRTEARPYAGEASGIRVGVMRGIRLKV